MKLSTFRLAFQQVIGRRLEAMTVHVDLTQGDAEAMTETLWSGYLQRYCERGLITEWQRSRWVHKRVPNKRVQRGVS